MRWYHYVTYFFGGAILVNAVPHFVSGVMGHPFQSPFAHRPAKDYRPRGSTSCGARQTSSLPTCSWGG